MSKFARLCANFLKRLFQEWPEITSSGVRWGLLQTFLSVAFFSLALFLTLFAYSPTGWFQMAVTETFLFIGLLFLVYSFWLAYKWEKFGSHDPTATKEDIARLEKVMNEGFTSVVAELKGLREDIQTLKEK